MTNLPRLGFSLFIQRGPHRLNLCNGLESCEAAIGAAREFAELRFVGLLDMVIRCETTGEQWPAETLVASLESRRAAGSRYSN